LFLKNETDKLIVLHYFCAKFIEMQSRRKNRGLYWVLFFLSCVALAVAIMTRWPWVTMILPFFGTFFVLAMDII